MRLQFRPLMAILPLTLLVLLVMISPLPEMIIGRVLNRDNALREEQGRAHERSALARTGRAETGELRAALEAREREASQLASLAELKHYLLRYGSATLSMPAFLRWYNELPDSEAVGVVEPLPLLRMVYGGRAASVDFQLRPANEEQHRLITLRVLDDKKLVLHEAAFDEATLRSNLRDLVRVGSSVQPSAPAGAGRQMPPSEWVADPNSIPEYYRASVAHLLLDPDLDIRTLYLAPGGELYIETWQDSSYTLYRLESEKPQVGWRFPWLGG